MNKMCITVAEAAEVSVPIRGLLNLTIMKKFINLQFIKAMVSVPIRGLLNLTDSSVASILLVLLPESFRPHQGIIEFNLYLQC